MDDVLGNIHYYLIKSVSIWSKFSSAILIKLTTEEVGELTLFEEFCKLVNILSKSL